MSPFPRDSETRTAEPATQGSIDLDSADLRDLPGSQWIRAQLPLLQKILSQLGDAELTPHQRVRALRNLRQPLVEMVSTLFRRERLESDPKVTALYPTLSEGQDLLEQMCQHLDHLLLTLDRRRFRCGPMDAEDRRWTIRQLLVFLGFQIEYGILAGRPWPSRTWQRLHDLFDYLVERGGLQVGTGSSDLGHGLDPETAYKRLLLLGLCPRLRGAQRLDPDLSNQLTRWAVETRLGQPAAHLGEYGLIVVETSKDDPAHYRRQPLSDPWRGWVLEAPKEFLAFAGIHRPSLCLATPGDDSRALIGGS